MHQNQTANLFGELPQLYEKFDLFASNEETGHATWTKQYFTEPKYTCTPTNRINSAAALCDGRLYVHSGRTVGFQDLSKEEQAEQIEQTPQQMDVLDLRKKTLKWTCYKHDDDDQPAPQMKWPSRTLTSWNSKLYLFGGESEKSTLNMKNKKRSVRYQHDCVGFATLYKYTIATCGWQKITPVGIHDVTSVPYPRIGHTATILLNDLCEKHEAGPKMLIFGGRSCNEINENEDDKEKDQNKLIDELWSFDLISETWQLVQTHGTAPSPRAGHSAVMIDSGKTQAPLLFIYGGIRYFDVKSNGNSFGGRNHTAVLGSSATAQHHSSSMVGSSAELFTFNTETLIWSTIFYTGLSPGPTFGHIAIAHPFTHEQGKFCVFGGKFSGSNLHPSNNMYCFDASLGSWTVINTKEEEKDEPLGSFGSVACSFRSSIVIYGGSTGRGCKLNKPKCINVLKFPKPPCLTPIDDIIARLNHNRVGNSNVYNSTDSLISYRVDYLNHENEREREQKSDNKNDDNHNNDIPGNINRSGQLKRTEKPFRLPTKRLNSKGLKSSNNNDNNDVLSNMLSVQAVEAVKIRTISSSVTPTPAHFDNRRSTWNNRPISTVEKKSTQSLEPLQKIKIVNKHRRNTFSHRPFGCGPSASSVAELVRRRDGGETKISSTGKVQLKKLVRTGGVSLTGRRVLRKSMVKL